MPLPENTVVFTWPVETSVLFPPHCICKPVAQSHTAERALSLSPSLSLRAIAWPGGASHFQPVMGICTALPANKTIDRGLELLHGVPAVSHSHKTQQMYT